MFFIMGISQGKKKLDYSKTVICNQCGSYGRYEVFMLYSYLSLFFIPLFKWNRRYYVQMSCCNTVYELDPETGRSLFAGKQVDIRESDLTLIQTGRRENSWSKKRCSACGYETTEDFEFCPKCGSRFE
jgi:ribosomal protein L37E